VAGATCFSTVRRDAALWTQQRSRRREALSTCDRLTSACARSLMKSVVLAIANALRASASPRGRLRAAQARRAHTVPTELYQQLAACNQDGAKPDRSSISPSLFENHGGEGRGRRRAERALIHLLKQARRSFSGSRDSPRVARRGPRARRTPHGAGGRGRRCSLGSLAGIEAADYRVKAGELAEDCCLGRRMHSPTRVARTRVRTRST
jgi:hypothetical protein